MKIKVTQKDIDSGENENSIKCPIAKAIRRTTKKDAVRVLYHYANFGNGTFIKLPKEATEFIKKYDNDKEVKPFEFDLDL